MWRVTDPAAGWGLLQAGLAGAVAAYITNLRAVGTTFASNSAAQDSSGSSSVDFLGSQRAGDCGALILWSCASAVITDSVLSGNSAAADGGAVCLNSTNLRLASSELDNNKVRCLLHWLERCTCAAYPIPFLNPPPVHRQRW
jgi:hypothetical protein